MNELESCVDKSFLNLWDKLVVVHKVINLLFEI